MISLWKRIPPGYRSTMFLWLVVLALFGIGESLYGGFFSRAHANAIFRTSAFIGLAAIGQTLVVLTGGIDLSVGPLISLGNVFACLMLAGKDENNLFAFSAILAIGLGVGLLNGVGVAILRISPMVMTMASGVITMGITLIYSQGAPTGFASPLLRQVGIGFTAGIPNSVWIWILLATATLVMLKSTTLGRGIYYVGANETAAVFSGLRAYAIKMTTYVISGLTASLTGIIIAGYTAVAAVNAGKDYVMTSITAVVIGGTAMTGGRGGYGGTIAGAVVICLIESLLTIMKMQEAGKKVANGLVVLILIILYYHKNRASKS